MNGLKLQDQCKMLEHQKDRSRLSRVSSEIRKTLAAQLNELGRNNKLGIVSVTKVDTSPDLRKATVYISVFGNEQQAEKYMELVNQSSGSLQKIISTRLRLKRTPLLQFALDDVLANESRIKELLRSP